MEDLVSGWLSRFTVALEQGAVGGIFAAECYWRDLVSFTWTLGGRTDGPGQMGKAFGVAQGIGCSKVQNV